MPERLDFYLLAELGLHGQVTSTEQKVHQKYKEELQTLKNQLEAIKTDSNVTWRKIDLLHERNPIAFSDEVTIAISIKFHS